MLSEKIGKKLDILIDLFKVRPLTIFMLTNENEENKVNFIYRYLDEME